MSVLILTGPPASGRITIAEHVARRIDRCAIVDVDALRQMVASPRHEPWQGPEGEAQQVLAVRNACALVKDFAEANFNVVVLDVLTDAASATYRKELSKLKPEVVLVLPTEAEVNSRLLSRPDYLSRGETDELYAQQAEFGDFDHKLDNTTLSPEQAADWLMERWRADKA